MFHLPCPFYLESILAAISFSYLEMLSDKIDEHRRRLVRLDPDSFGFLLKFMPLHTLQRFQVHIHEANQQFKIQREK